MSKKPPHPLSIPAEKADLNGITIMMEAARFNLPAMIADYVKAKHNINAIDNAGNNALFHAAEHGSTEAANMLMFHKIDLTQINKAGELALHIAAAKKMQEVVVRWVKAKAPLDVQDKTARNTPLMKSIKADDIYSSVALIDAGADFEKLFNADGQNAAQMGLNRFEGKDLEFFTSAVKRRHDAEMKRRQADETRQQKFRADITTAASAVGHDVAAPEKASFKKKPRAPKA